MSEKVSVSPTCARILGDVAREKLAVNDRLTTVPDNGAIKDLREAVRELRDAERKAKEG